MPTYEFQCKACGRSFDSVMTVRQRQRGSKVPCPKCSSRKVEPRVSLFQAVTAKKG